MLKTSAGGGGTSDGLNGRVPGGSDPGGSAIEFDWQDEIRQRRVPARLYLPFAAAVGPLPRTAQATSPLLLFSHGLGSGRQGYQYLAWHLCAAGFACLHVQHVGSDASLWQGDPATLAQRVRAATGDSEAIARCEDMRFALSKLREMQGADDALVSGLDFSRIAAGGHSYGANTAMLLGGARIVRHGQPLKLAEPAVQALLLLCAPRFFGETDQAQVLSGVRLPALHLSATGDAIQMAGRHSPPQDRLSLFEDMDSRQKALCLFKGGEHKSFTDGPSVDPVFPGERPSDPVSDQTHAIHAGVQAFSEAFLRAVFATPKPLIQSSCPAPNTDWASSLLALQHRYARQIQRFELVCRD